MNEMGRKTRHAALRSWHGQPAHALAATAANAWAGSPCHTAPFAGACVLLFVMGLLLIGCHDRDGWFPIPPAQLHAVDSLRLDPSPAKPGASIYPPSATMPTTLPATWPSTAPAEAPLSLEQCRKMCLENNLNLKVALINPTIAKQSIDQAEAQFESLFTVGSSATWNRTGGAEGAPNIDGTQYQATPGVTVPLRTGGQILIDSPISRTKTEGLDASYSTGLAFSISQPLLRGAGVEVNTSAIRIARLNYQISQAQTKLEVIRVLADVEREYWRLYAARQSLQIAKRSYDLAQATLERSRRMAAAAQVPESEEIDAEAAVASRVQAVIDAENAVRLEQRTLKRMLNQPGLEMESTTIVVPENPPTPVHFELSAPALEEAALKNRMEMLQTELHLAQQAITIASAHNGLLPAVAVSYTYNINALGPTPADAFDMAFENRADSHVLGFNISVPIGNQAARAALRSALLGRLQALTNQQDQVLQIRLDVLQRIDTLESGWQSLLASRATVVTSARRLAAQQRRFEQGMQSSLEVLRAQNDLASAQVSEISAVTQYQIAQVDMAVATGTLLGAMRIQWEPAPAPQTLKPKLPF